MKYNTILPNGVSPRARWRHKKTNQIWIIDEIDRSGKEVLLHMSTDNGKTRKVKANKIVDSFVLYKRGFE